MKQAKLMEKCLKDFYNISGQRVNTGKSKIYVSPNMRRGLANAVRKNFGISLTVYLDKYLGVPTQIL